MNTDTILQLEKLIADHEANLSYKYGGDVVEKTSHVLRQYKSIADNAIYQAKQFVEDCKTQFNALIIVLEGLTG
jgi:uncharacterized lipoprotein YehR (DUF1307 family)